MISALHLAVSLALSASVAPEPCASPESSPASEPADRDAGPVYLEVGDEARAAGDLETARAAYRQALRVGAPDAAARLSEVCREASAPPTRIAAATASAPADDHFAAGLRLLERGDRVAARAAFEGARAAGDDGAAALLEGLCELELGHEDRATRLFELARADPALAATATFYLGLAAYRAGQSERAFSLLTEAGARDERLAPATATLTRFARRDGHVVVSAIAEVGFDSNVELRPDGSASPMGSADGSAASAASISARLFGRSGPYARLAGHYREQFVVSSFDLGGASGALGARLASASQELAAEYGYDFLALGGATYLSAHRVGANGRATLGPIGFAGSYAARFESFLTDAARAYSGVRHDGEGQVIFAARSRFTLGAGYHVGRDVTRSDAALSYFEHGPLVAAQLGVARTLRFVAEGHFTARRYDTVDPDLAQLRSDRYLDGFVAAEIDVGRAWTARLTSTARRALSNVAEFRYSKLTTSVGLVYTIGAL